MKDFSRFLFLPKFLLLALNKGIAVEFGPCPSAPFYLHFCLPTVPWCCGPPPPAPQFRPNPPSASACWAFPPPFIAASFNSACPRAGSSSWVGSWELWRGKMVACGNRSSIQGLWLELVPGQPQRSGKRYAVHIPWGSNGEIAWPKQKLPWCIVCTHVCIHLGWRWGTMEE